MWIIQIIFVSMPHLQNVKKFKLHGKSVFFSDLNQQVQPDLPDNSTSDDISIHRTKLWLQRMMSQVGGLPFDVKCGSIYKIYQQYTYYYGHIQHNHLGVQIISCCIFIQQFTRLEQFICPVCLLKARPTFNLPRTIKQKGFRIKMDVAMNLKKNKI